jgi:hypothetical protein
MQWTAGAGWQKRTQRLPNSGERRKASATRPAVVAVQDKGRPRI